LVAAGRLSAKRSLREGMHDRPQSARVLRLDRRSAVLSNKIVVRCRVLLVDKPDAGAPAASLDRFSIDDLSADPGGAWLSACF
jgi:hypothetical protein